MVAGVPNRLIASLSASTAFPGVACVKTPDAMMRREESSRHVTGRKPLNRGSSISCQPACHMALECLLPGLTHLRLLDFAADGTTTTRPFSLMIWYVGL